MVALGEVGGRRIKHAHEPAGFMYHHRAVVSLFTVPGLCGVMIAEETAEMFNRDARRAAPDTGRASTVVDLPPDGLSRTQRAPADVSGCTTQGCAAVFTVCTSGATRNLTVHDVIIQKELLSLLRQL